jgi:hypothetical protein
MADDYVDAIRPANWFERQVNRLPNDAGRLLVRNLVGLAPGTLLLGPVLAWLVFAPAQVAAYEVAWRVYPKAPIRVADAVVGALWGGLLWIVAGA